MKLDSERVIGCRSDAERFELVGDIAVLGANPCVLKSGAPDIATKTREIITSIRAGQHVTLELSALTFRQKDGVPNRRKIRFATDALEAVASSFVGMPVLLDHNTSEQAARIGTITASELTTHGGTGWATLRQKLMIVKPEAVISVLDGTLDRFSIGWIPTGPVLCSVHRTDVRSRGACSCWPGDVLDVDGKSATVEWEFTSADGIEVSAVNVPAVKGTKIEDIRTALSAELSLIRESSPTLGVSMSMTRTAATLGLAALATPDDDARGARIVEDIKRDKLAAEQERDTFAARTKTAEDKLAVSELAASEARAASDKVQTDALLESAYREGKLLYGRDGEGASIASPREVRLRRIAKEDGLSALESELKEYPVLAPLNQRVLKDADPNPRRTNSVSAPALSSVAAQLGLDPGDLETHASNIGANRPSKDS